MKTMKKLFALLLAVLMVMGMATTAMADDPQPVTEITITITNNTSVTHTYAAYQIFVGDLSDTGVLSNVEWGNGIKGNELLGELKKGAEANSNGENKYPLFKTGDANAFANAETAGAVAEIIATWPYNEKDIKTFADLIVNGGFLNNTPYTSNDTNGDTTKDEAGVYKISIKAPTDSSVAEKRITGYYLIKDNNDNNVVGNDGATDFLLQVAKDISIRPKVSHPTFSKTVNKSEDGTYSDAISAQVGDKVWFKLEAKLPSSFNDYNAYHLHFTDSLPAGLDIEEGSGVMYIQHASTKKTSLSTDNENVVDIQHDTTNRTVTIDFMDLKKTLSEANITISENDTLIIKYAANVTKEACLGSNTDKGNKNNASMKFSNDMNQPAGTVEGEVTHGTMTDSASVYVYQANIQKIDSVTSVGLSGAEFYLYRNYVNADNSTTKMYAQFTTDGTGVYKITEWKLTEPSVTLVSGTNGYFTVSGLDALTYYLEEHKSPVGYTEMKEDVPLTISVEYNGQDIKTGTLSGSADNVPAYEVDEVTGTVKVRVKNVLGAALPTTGGIGTTIFYIVGGVLVLGAGAAFVMKRRNEEA